ncbi:hypothetical protein BX616_003787 [Lobosporangium transversale]|uniref:Uncharacterized protein n=1 Tax=Lobosporangium transversale TaxID=64571 RepID=A0A1Y2GXW9_9FUNG|nr:hypothetical protein BCR41DRAFT_347523 [Lobosporangium transversale]KAF9898638.1 hypothetical protein BX616_003787 [Lobosporangium transversale]ORZ27158.1 hypothetical protein BCR41DRAFT_347523 [Lobosporangium transversale]|eukprot:XP_021884905.1 hypothetical protein BCR41DRAFT_347523 [Lobosporangium transversale]
MSRSNRNNLVGIHSLHSRNPDNDESIVRRSTSNTSIGTNSSSAAPPLRNSQLLINDHDTELDWRYLSTTETYSSECSAPMGDDEVDDLEIDQATVDPTVRLISNSIKHQRGLGSRPLQTFATSPSSASGMFSTSPGKPTTHEADKSTDTIKNMRARALDKINGRKESSSNLDSAYSNTSAGTTSNKNNDDKANNASKRVTITLSTAQGYDFLPNQSSTTTKEEIFASRASGHGRSGSFSNGSGIRLKRRSLGPSLSVHRSVVTRVSQPEAHHTIPETATRLSSQNNVIKKHNSGPFKNQKEQLRSTSEDEPDTVKSRNTTAAKGGGILVSELRALKARVEELELERMNRSLSDLRVQSPQTMTIQYQQRQQQQRELEEQQQPSSTHSEKVRQLMMESQNRGLTKTMDSSSGPLRSPISITAATPKERSSSFNMDRLEPPVRIDSPLRIASMAATPQPTTQHVALLQEAFRAFEKTMSMGHHNGSGMHASVQAMSKVVTNAVNMNQTIRTWIKADIALVDSSSMAALGRASDEQIRSLTESLLAMTTTSLALDRSFPQSEMAIMNQSYSPIPAGSLRFAQGQRLSLIGIGSSQEPSLLQQNAPEFISSQQRRQINVSSEHPVMESPQAMRHCPPILQRQSQSPAPEGTEASVQLARRQNNVRNIMARYAHAGSRAPAFGQSSQENNTDMDQLRHEDVMSNYLEQQQQQYIESNIYQTPQYSQDNPDGMPASVEVLSSGHPGVVHGSRRPLSQQELYSYSGTSSRMSVPQIRKGVGIHRSGRYAHDKVFSEDESIGGWDTMSSTEQAPHQQRRASQIGRYALRLQQLHGRHGQLQPLHQQLDQFEQQQNQQQQRQQQRQHVRRGEEYSDGAESDMFAESIVPLFAQRSQQGTTARISQHLHHQDMMMINPAMPSPNSSPSSSSRLDAPSVVSSNSHHGGLASVDVRNHFSPRGPADPTSFPRQQSISSISGLSDDSQFSPRGSLQQQRQKTLAHQRVQQQPLHSSDGMSPQAKARLQQILNES